MIGNYYKVCLFECEFILRVGTIRIYNKIRFRG